MHYKGSCFINNNAENGLTLIASACYGLVMASCPEIVYQLGASQTIRVKGSFLWLLTDQESLRCPVNFSGAIANCKLE